MNNDLVARLRAKKKWDFSETTPMTYVWKETNEPDPDCQKAADEIERLRAELLRCK